MNPDFQNMWTGNISSQGDSFPPQWAMNPATPYMNMPHEQVDWASLAQQWIKMKEEIPPNEKEGGEAPMDITKEEASINAGQNSEWQNSTSQPVSDGNWNTNWGWDQSSGWCWNTPKPPPAPTYSTAAYTAALVTPEPTAPAATQPVFPYSATQPPPPAAETFSTTPAFWTGTTTDTKESWNHHSHTKRKDDSSNNSHHELDAAKRKQLPAWIREGLEKMEREKQKKAEHEKMERLRKEELSKKTEILNIDISAGSNGEPQLPKKSKFDSDSEDSEPEIIEANNKREGLREQPRRSRFDWSGPQAAPVKPVYRTKEQILQASMVDVRKILTQILMEVTNEEIRKAVDDVYKKLKKKAPAATIRKTPALASLTGKLGLGIYESDSGSESEPEKVTDPDSDQELRDRIERLKSEFTKVEQHIEREALEQEERERRQLQPEIVSNEGSPKDVEDQVQPINEGVLANKNEKYQMSDSKYRETYDGKKERLNETQENSRDKRVVKRSEYRRSRSYQESSSCTSSSDSRSPSPYYKRKHKHHRSDRKSSRYSRSRSRSRTRDRSRDRRHKRKNSRHRSNSRKRRQRSTDRRGRHGSSSSSSCGRHSRKSGHRR